MNKYTHGGVNRIDATVHFFDSPGQIEWYWRLFKRKFWHVSVTLRKQSYTLTIDPRMPYIDASKGTLVGFGHTSLKVKRDVSLSDPPWAILAPGTCVTVVKGVLGIRAWWIFTPYQLYKYLLKNGAKPV